MLLPINISVFENVPKVSQFFVHFLSILIYFVHFVHFFITSFFKKNFLEGMVENSIWFSEFFALKTLVNKYFKAEKKMMLQNFSKFES